MASVDFIDVPKCFGDHPVIKGVTAPYGSHRIRHWRICSMWEQSAESNRLAGNGEAQLKPTLSKEEASWQISN